MCSFYARDARAMCACFLGKDDRVVEDLVALQSEALLWSGAGSGVISLADLETELRGQRAWDRDGRPDQEFIRACHARGLKVFGVVFTAQGYEVAVELDRDENTILSFGRVTGRGQSGTWGLNEFYQERYPGIYPSFKRYLTPARLSHMEKALAGRDFLDEAACRDLHGEKSLCYWVNSSGLPRDLRYTNYFMCKNSPLWQEHLKLIIEAQIDAGFDGIQFDEPGLSMEVGGTRAGFCGHCREKFRGYLVERYGAEFKDFDYAALLRKKGAGIMSELAYFKGLPYWQDWKRSLLIDAQNNFKALADHARAYAKSLGKEIPIAANFAFWMPHHLALAREADVFSLEYHPAIPPAGSNLIYPAIGRALDEQKPVTMVPHIAFAAQLRERAKTKKPDGSGADVNLLRYLIAEAAFGGGDFMVPYSCIGLSGEGGYFPPIEPIAGYLQFVKKLREKWRAAKTMDQAVAVLSFASYFWTFDFLNLPGQHFASLAAALRSLSNLGIQHRLVIWGDGEAVADRGEVSREELLVLPDVSHITDAQAGKLRSFIEDGGNALVLGAFAARGPMNRKREREPFFRLKPGENKWGKGGLYFMADGPDYDRLLQEGLAATGLAPRVLVDAPSGLKPLLKLGECRGKLLINLLNRDYRYPEDSFAPVRNAELVIARGFGREPRGFTVTCPEREPIEIKAGSAGHELRFALPELNIFCCLEEIG